MASDGGGAGDGLWPAAALLADPLRRRVYAVVVEHDDGATREVVAGELGLARSTAAFHLERLANAGLLAVEFRRLNGRSGPGAGRPAKVYRRGDAEFALSVPGRLYALAGSVMAEAIEHAAAGASPKAALHDAASRAGRRLAAGADDLADALARSGFEPRTAGDDTVLGTCPFHRLAQEHPGVVCALNHSLVGAMADEVGDTAERVHADPGAGGCCLRISP
ncbi:helix-turn-helix transcriptional regulator [Agromyces sp. MMS24-JH15]|uniref:helix-turn-helix transcriptional regulator n=1 Tax=Agromyces sp. MMS24-JH15 TaxID=3243765 RepID=UPI003748932E